MVTGTFVGCGEQKPAGPTPAEMEASKKAEAEAKKKAEEDAKKKAEAEAKKKAEEEAKKSAAKVVFDPRKPPAGYTTCHRNHCHKVGGGVASYSQVMKEIGATEIVGVPKQAPMPKAPADVAAPPADAAKTKSGLATKVLRAGDGKEKPSATSVVSVHYTGWTTDGKAFDSSVSRGRPATFPLNRVIPGWTEGLQLMSVGEERRLWIPEELAYKGRPGAPQGMLVFDVELLEIKPAP
jgi:hypothetical protein